MQIPIVIVIASLTSSARTLFRCAAAYAAASHSKTLDMEHIIAVAGSGHYSERNGEYMSDTYDLTSPVFSEYMPDDVPIITVSFEVKDVLREVFVPGQSTGSDKVISLVMERMGKEVPEHLRGAFLMRKFTPDEIARLEALKRRMED